jgi:demethylmenaquinone methyltransferase/2-methoxy-6-polyprenyl-1,4-benzoquinol methylase
MPFDHFAFIAPLYERIGSYSSLDEMLKHAQLPVQGRLLDVGGGTGRVAAALRDAASELVVADVSFPMLSYAASKPGLWAVAAASERLPFPDASFARVIMVDALHHVADQGKTAAELWRVLQPGGRIVIEEPDIHNVWVKGIALAEKLLLMRSHFLSPTRIAALFPRAQEYVIRKGATAWVVIEKPQ